MIKEGYHSGIEVNVLDRNIVVSEFELGSHVYFQSDTLRKGINLLILRDMD